MQPFIVNLIGLKSGTIDFDWTVGAEFFETFGNQEILDAHLEVDVRLHNHGLTIDAECDVYGSVTVACDRCLEDLEIPVEVSFDESYTPEGDVLDLSQDVYDYVLTSLPLQRVHPEGECNEETTKYLSK